MVTYHPSTSSSVAFIDEFDNNCISTDSEADTAYTNRLYRPRLASNLTGVSEVFTTDMEGGRMFGASRPESCVTYLDGRLSERRNALSISTSNVKISRFSAYCISEKGHDLMRALSSVVVVMLTIVGLTLLFAHVFGAKIVDEHTVNEFFLTLYVTCILAIWTLLLLASMGKLTNDYHYRDQSETNFLRGGILCLGTGGIMYYAVAGASIGLESSHCVDPWDIVNPVVSIVFTCSEMSLILKYSRIRINKNLPVVLTSQFLIVIVIATNLCVWIKTVVLESQEEILKQKDEHTERMGLTNAPPIEKGDIHAGTEGKNNTGGECIAAAKLQHQIKPYTWPLLIEFCVVSSTCMIAILERCGRGLQLDDGLGTTDQLEMRTTSVTSYDEVAMDEALEDTRGNMTSLCSISTTTRALCRLNSHQRRTRYYNSQLGFLAGWVMVVLSVVLIIIYLYVIATPTPEHPVNMENSIYGTSMAISGICLITVPFTMMRMAGLVFRDEEIRRIKEASRNAEGGDTQTTQHARMLNNKGSLQRTIDRQLLSATNLAQMAFHLMSMIAATQTNSTIIFANSMVSLLMACGQTVFINWYALQKRSTTDEHLATKPGRQGLELLRCGNLALWLINTFAVKHPTAKRVQNKVFGIISWAVVSNITQPLLILYHFHSVCCLTEVINHSYTDEYLGVTRPLRLPKAMVAEEAQRQKSNSIAIDSRSVVFSGEGSPVPSPGISTIENDILGSYL